MKLLNNGGKFTIIYDGTDYDIPSGEFEVTNNILGHFIQRKSIEWGKHIEILDDTTAVLRPKIRKVKEKVEEMPKQAEKIEEEVPEQEKIKEKVKDKKDEKKSK